MEPVVRKPPDHAVVADVAVLAEEQAISAAAGGELGPRVRVHAGHELDRVRPRGLDLAKRRGVAAAYRGPGHPAFAGGWCAHVLVAAPETPRPAPRAH